MYSSNTWPLIILIATTVILTAIIVIDRVRRKKRGEPPKEVVGYSQFQDRGEIRDPAKRATTSMVAGIVGLVFASIILGILALLNGLSARKKLDETDHRSYSHAKVGIVLGIFDIVSGIVQIIILLIII